MKPYKGLSIYPKIIKDKPLSDFTPEEKKHLTRKKFHWRVYFSYLNEDGKYDRQPPFTCGVNRDFKNFNERYKAIHRLLRATKQMLDDGHSPKDITLVNNEVVTIKKGIDYALSNKKLSVSPDTYKSYEVQAKRLKKFLKNKGMLNRGLQTFNFSVIREFLKGIAKTSSIANRNAVLRSIKPLFTEMYENDLIADNYMAKIKPIKTTVTKANTYSHKEATDIIEHLEKEDPIMALFIKFVSYNFLRPKEVVRLKVGDLDLENKTLRVFVKQGKFKTKRIPDEIVSDLSKYDLTQKEQFLFTPQKIGGDWDRDERGRRENFSKRYARRKKELGYGTGYTIYSFRHTYITIGYRNLRKRLSKDAAIDELMRYTGHDSRSALIGYIHYHDIDIVDEYQGEVK